MHRDAATDCKTALNGIVTETKERRLKPCGLPHRVQQLTENPMYLRGVERRREVFSPRLGFISPTKYAR